MLGSCTAGSETWDSPHHADEECTKRTYRCNGWDLSNVVGCWFGKCLADGRQPRWQLHLMLIVENFLLAGVGYPKRPSRSQIISVSRVWGHCQLSQAAAVWVSSGPYLSNNAAFTVLTFLDFAGSTTCVFAFLHIEYISHSSSESTFSGVISPQSQVGPLTWTAIQKGQPLDHQACNSS